MKHELTEYFTHALRDGFTEDNTLLVVELDRADSVLELKIEEFRNVPYEAVEIESDRYIAFLIVSYIFRDLHDNKVLWEEKEAEEHVVYTPEEGEDEADREDALFATLIDRHVSQIIDRTVSGW
jgi:hypothetical protein